MDMDIKFLSCYVIDVDSALYDGKFSEVDKYIEETQPLIKAAELKAMKLAGFLNTWSRCVLEDGVTAETEIYVDDMVKDSEELQEIKELLLDVYRCNETLKNNKEYQNWRRRAA